MQTPSGDMLARAILLACSVDLPARAMLVNMKQWNGLHGCLYCENEGVTLGTDHLHRYWIPKDSQVRTHNYLLHHVEAATITGSAVSLPLILGIVLLITVFLVTKMASCHCPFVGLWGERTHCVGFTSPF